MLWMFILLDFGLFPKAQDGWWTGLGRAHFFF